MNQVNTSADPAAFEIVKNSLYKIAEEMRVVLAKTAYSPILKSAGDYSCGVFDAAGAMVAQGPDLPIHLGSMPDAVRAIVEAFGGDVHDGDVFIHDDRYYVGNRLRTTREGIFYLDPEEIRTGGRSRYGMGCVHGADVCPAARTVRARFPVVAQGT